MKVRKTIAKCPNMKCDKPKKTNGLYGFSEKPKTGQGYKYDYQTAINQVKEFLCDDRDKMREALTNIAIEEASYLDRLSHIDTPIAYDHRCLNVPVSHNKSSREKLEKEIKFDFGLRKNEYERRIAQAEYYIRRFNCLIRKPT